MDLGAKFWFGLVGLVIAIGLGAILIFGLMGRVWYAWGFFGMLLFFGLLLGVMSFFYDRREARRDARRDADIPA